MKEYLFGNYRIPERMMEGINRYIKQGIKPGNFLTAVIQNDFQEVAHRADRENLMNLPAYAGYFFNQAPSGSFGSPEIMEAWLAKFRKDSTPACTHERVKPSHDYVTCKSCGWVKTGRYGDTWGVAKDKWFKSLVEAGFYQQHGRLPDDG